jgi:hypothetical protein
MRVDGVDGERLVLETFLRLRKSGFNLGLDEYFAGLALITGEEGAIPFARDLDSLKRSLKSIWCTSQSEQKQFDPDWEKALAVVQAASPAALETENAPPLPPRPPIEPPLATPPRFDQSPPESVTEEAAPPTLDAAAQPVRAPFTPAEIERPSELQSYWPVSRRFMSYSWRYLRRTVEAGPAELLDVEATVQQTAQQGFYLEPVLRQRDQNQAQLVMLIDQNGSMMPLHQFTREVANTALYNSGLPPEQVFVYYFQNVPADYIYKDVFLTQPEELKAVLAACDSDTSVLVVSDAGAARGYRRLERIRATVRFLTQLRRTTQLCAWLNPIPAERWSGNSAEMIANLVPMFQMDNDGLSNAIDVVRGLLVQPTQP